MASGEFVLSFMKFKLGNLVTLIFKTQQMLPAKYTCSTSLSLSPVSHPTFRKPDLSQITSLLLDSFLFLGLIPFFFLLPPTQTRQ